MGFFDKAKEFAGKKYHDLQEAEKKRGEIRKVEKAEYDAEFQKARLSSMKQKARVDARASVFPRKGARPQRSFLENIGENSLRAGEMFGGGGLGSNQKKGKAYKPMKLDAMDLNTMGAGAMFKRKRR